MTALGQMAPAPNWLGYGARPYLQAEAAPGEYYVPSKHPYQATLPDGIQVQEAYPGQYYLTGVGQEGQPAEVTPNYWVGAWSAASTASMVVSAYHGYKRHNSVPWALWWGLMGAVTLVTPAVAVAQGFGKRKR